MNELTKKQIEVFWTWFKLSVGPAENPLSDPVFTKSLDDKVSEFPGIYWELGPGYVDPDKTALVLSPGGNRDALDITVAFIAQAPHLEGWEFYPAKPPKRWGLFFTVEGPHGITVEVDANNWQYVLLRHQGSAYEIVIRMAEFDRLSSELRVTAAEIALDGELGEALRMQTIGVIDLVREFDPKLAGKINSFRNLKGHVSSLLDSLGHA